MIRITLALATLLALCISARVGATDLEDLGGGGGLAFRRTCETGSFLVGLHARTGDWVDSMQLACARWSGATLETAHLIDPPLGDSPGGIPNDVYCPAGAAMVAMDAAFTQDNNSHAAFLDEATLQCVAVTTSRVNSAPGYELRLRSGGTHADFYVHSGLMRCPPEELVVGFYGRAGLFIDRIGLICAAAPEPSTHSELGRAPPAGDPRFGARNRVGAARTQADASIAVETGIGSTSAGQARARTQFGIVVPRPADAPPAAAPSALPGERFAPPTFPDGARLWACTDAGDALCNGRAASIAYCAARGLHGPVQSALPRMMERGRQAVQVKNVRGAACIERSCAVVDELSCSH